MFGLFLLSAAAAAPVSATSAPPAKPDEIVVQGVRERNRAIHDFMRAVTPAEPVTGQLRRYQYSVCPAAVGLPDAQNRQIAQRLRDVAGAVGMQLAKEPCGPNALVIVVDDKKDFIAALHRKYPAYFMDERGFGVDIGREPGPTAAWHVEGRLTADHTPAAMNPIYHYYVVSSTDSSRIRPASIPYFIGGVLVVELRALGGLTTTQLADYAAMRLYAKTDPARLKPSASSILGVLNAPMGSAVPITLTSWDLTFLKGLYQVNDRQYANRQRDEIEGMVKRNKASGNP
jgi:hypothetical protein